MTEEVRKKGDSKNVDGGVGIVDAVWDSVGMVLAGVIGETKAEGAKEASLRELSLARRDLNLFSGESAHEDVPDVEQNARC